VVRSWRLIRPTAVPTTSQRASGEHASEVIASVSTPIARRLVSPASHSVPLAPATTTRSLCGTVRIIATESWIVPISREVSPAPDQRATLPSRVPTRKRSPSDANATAVTAS
jgi:hypothetical protein